MKILLVKTSSMGDIIHTLPAVTDLKHYYPDASIDWLVEESFADLPKLHRGIDQLIPVALRRWRRQPWCTTNRRQIATCYRALRATRYDYIIDAQGLMKSALLAQFVRGPVHGYARASIREPLASYGYQYRYHMPWDWHAIERIRGLVAAVFGRQSPDSALDYGLTRPPPAASRDPYWVFIHSTSRAEKCWPERCWQATAQLAAAAGIKILLPWGSPLEHQRAKRIAQGCAAARVLPRQSLTELAAILAQAAGVVAVDTGLAHLAAALSTPCLTLYGPTDPLKIGTRGEHQAHLLFEAASPEGVVDWLQAFLPVNQSYSNLT